MATTIKLRGPSDSNEEVVLVGRAQRPLTKIVSLLRSRVIREVTLPIENVSEEPELTFSATLVAPTQLQESQSVQLSANLFSQVADGPLTLVENYDPTHWTKAVTSGGSSASLGGPNGDVLTATTTLGEVVVTFTYNVADSEALGTVATATVEVVASPVFNVVVTGLPASVVQGNSYTLGAERRDGETGQVVDSNPANFVFTITSGGTFASITNGNQLNINPGTAGNSVTVQAAHNISGSGQASTNIIVQPAFPNNEPAGMSTRLAAQGDTLTFPGPATWNPNALWSDPSRIAVVADGASKFGQVLEKRWKLGDNAGWYALNIGQVGLWRELFIRVVYMIPSNYQRHHTGAEKFIYYNQGGQGGGTGDFVLWHTASNSSNSISWSDGGSVNTCVPQKPSGGDLGELQRGVYHTVEIHHVASLNPGEGSLRMWIDDIEYTSFRKFGEGVVPLTNRTWTATTGISDKRLGARVELPLFWGGAGGTKGVNDFMRFSEIYISGKN